MKSIRRRTLAHHLLSFRSDIPTTTETESNTKLYNLPQNIIPIKKHDGTIYLDDFEQQYRASTLQKCFICLMMISNPSTTTAKCIPRNYKSIDMAKKNRATVINTLKTDILSSIGKEYENDVIVLGITPNSEDDRSQRYHTDESELSPKTRFNIVIPIEKDAASTQLTDGGEACQVGSGKFFDVAIPHRAPEPRKTTGITIIVPSELAGRVETATIKSLMGEKEEVGNSLAEKKMRSIKESFDEKQTNLLQSLRGLGINVKLETEKIFSAPSIEKITIGGKGPLDLKRKVKDVFTNSRLGIGFVTIVVNTDGIILKQMRPLTTEFSVVIE